MALSITEQYGMIFNFSFDPTAPKVQATPQVVLDKAIIAKDADPTFVRDVFSVIPSVTDSPVECGEVEVIHVLELETIHSQIQQMADMATYLLNPAYPIAADIQGYYSCRNTLYADHC